MVFLEGRFSYKYCSGVESTSKFYYDRSYKSESNGVVRKLDLRHECEGGTARSIHCESISEVAETFIIKQLHAFSPPSGVDYDHELHTPFFSAKNFNDPIFCPQLHCGFFHATRGVPPFGKQIVHVPELSLSSHRANPRSQKISGSFV